MAAKVVQVNTGTYAHEKLIIRHYTAHIILYVVYYARPVGVVTKVKYCPVLTDFQ